MTTAQKLEAHRRRRHAGRGHRPLHARAVAVGSGDVRADGARRLAARRPKCGSARTSCSATTAPATSRCCGRSARRYGFKAEKIDPVRYKDFVVSSTRIRRLVGEGRVDEAGALLGHQYFIDGTVVEGDRRGRTIGFPTANLQHRERAAAAARRVRDDGDDRRRRAPVGDQHRRPADGRRVGPDVDRDAHLRLRSRPVRRVGPRRASCSGCATSARSSRSTRCERRSPPTAAGRACSSIAFHCRIVASCRDMSFCFALEFSGQAAVRACCGDLAGAGAARTSAAPDAVPRRLAELRSGGRRGARRRRRAATCSFRRTPAASSRSSCRRDGGRDLADRPSDCLSPHS